MRARRFEADNYLSRTRPRRLARPLVLREPDSSPRRRSEPSSKRGASRPFSRNRRAANSPRVTSRECRLATTARARTVDCLPVSRQAASTTFARIRMTRLQKSSEIPVAVVKDDLRQRAREVVGAVPLSQHCESAPLESANLTPPLAGWRVRGDLQASGPLPLRTSTSTDAALLLPGEAGGPPTSSRVAAVSSESGCEARPLVLVQGSSEVGDELDAWSVGMGKSRCLPGSRRFADKRRPGCCSLCRRRSRRSLPSQQDDPRGQHAAAPLRGGRACPTDPGATTAHSRGRRRPRERCARRVPDCDRA